MEFLVDHKYADFSFISADSILSNVRNHFLQNNSYLYKMKTCFEKGTTLRKIITLKVKLFQDYSRKFI